jgi:hypothetical protein
MTFLVQTPGGKTRGTMDMQQLKQLEQVATLAANMYTLALTSGAHRPEMVKMLKARSDSAAADYRNAWREYQTKAAK